MIPELQLPLRHTQAKAEFMGQRRYCAFGCQSRFRSNAAVGHKQATLAKADLPKRSPWDKAAAALQLALPFYA